MPVSDQVGHLFQLLQSAIWVTVNEDVENLLNVVSNAVSVVDVGRGAQDAVQVLLLLVLAHQGLHDLGDLNISGSDHWVLGDVGNRLRFLLLNVVHVGVVSPACLVLLRHIVYFCNVKKSIDY